MKASFSFVLCAALFCLASTSAHPCGCGKARLNRQLSQPLDDAHAQFSSSMLLELAQLRADAAAAQQIGQDGQHRVYTHAIYSDSNGQVKETSRRQLGSRAVVEETTDGRTWRKLHGLKEAELQSFEQDWDGALGRQQPPARKAGLEHKPACSARAQKPACVKQEYPNGATVDVMMLEPGESSSDEWERVLVESMSCDGKYKLRTPGGEAVRAALPTGIEHQHLRPARHFRMPMRRAQQQDKKTPAQQPADELEERVQQALKDLKQQSQHTRVAQRNLDSAKAAERTGKASRIDNELKKAKAHLAQLEEARMRMAHE